MTRATAPNKSEQCETQSALFCYFVYSEIQSGKTQTFRIFLDSMVWVSVQKLSGEATPDMSLVSIDIRQMEQDDPTLSALLLRANGETEVKSDANKEQ